MKLLIRTILCTVLFITILTNLLASEPPTLLVGVTKTFIVMKGTLREQSFWPNQYYFIRVYTGKQPFGTRLTVIYPREQNVIRGYHAPEFIDAQGYATVPIPKVWNKIDQMYCEVWLGGSSDGTGHKVIVPFTQLSALVQVRVLGMAKSRAVGTDVGIRNWVQKILVGN